MDPSDGQLSLDDRAYLYFPNQKEQKTEFTKKGTRFFFFGQIVHDDYEKKKLGEFEEYVVKNKVGYNKEFFDDQRVLLFLQASGYKPKDTLEAMEQHLNFRRTYLPVDFSKVEKILKGGFFYVCGRDMNFRPVLVFNAKLIDFQNVQMGINAACYIHEMVIKHMFLPGQVENWVAIYDLGGMGVTEMPINAIKETVGVMSANYGGKLFKMFVVNAPTTIWFGWKAVSVFLDPVTVEKITISKTNTDKNIFTNVHPSQVEIKYGGTQADRKQYWPMSIPEGVFDEKRLITWDQYQKKLEMGQLKKNRIHGKYLVKNLE